MYSLLKPVIFKLDPEFTHEAALRLMRLLGMVKPLRSLIRGVYCVPSKPIEVFGLTFPNRVGLAAGYDKDGLAWRGLACLGFGHIEVGTVTLRPQGGNPRPRIQRIPQAHALINSMGFPSRGAKYVADQLQGPRPDNLVLGVNLGINKDTPLDRASDDYCELMRIFAPLADYVAINISSPNTPGLRNLQSKSRLEKLLSRLGEVRGVQEQKLGRGVPLLVKLSPDLSNAELDDVLGVVIDNGIDGIIATNTTINRNGLSALAGKAHYQTNPSGGLSGMPLRERSTRMIEYIHRATAGRLPIAAAGGVMSAQDACEKLEAGAKLVQIYTGLVYKGPSLVKEILRSV